MASQQAMRAVPSLVVLTLLGGVVDARAESSDPDPALPAEPAIDAPTQETHKTRVVGRASFTQKVSGLPLELMRPRVPEEALELVPGLVVVQHGNEGKAPQLYLRGFDALHGADFEVQFEGVRLNEHSNAHATGYFDLTLLPVSLLRSVAVDKGPFELAQGLFGTAGTAHYTLGTDPAHRGAHIGYGFGTTHRHQAHVSIAPDDPSDDSMVGGEVVTDQGYGQGRGLKRLALAARVAPPARGPDALSLSILLGLARFDLPGLIADDDVDSGFVDFLGAYDDLGRGESDRLLAIMRHVHDVDDTHVETAMHVGWRKLLLRENFTGDVSDAIHGDARLQVEQRLHFGLHTRVLAVLGPFRFEGLAGVRRDDLDQRIDRVDDLDQRLSLERSLTASLSEAWLAPGLIYDTAFWSARLGARTTLLDHRVTGRNHSWFLLLPRLDVSLRPTLASTVRLAYGRQARPPEAQASTSSAGTRPEATYSDSLELAYRLRLDDLEASLAAFWTGVGRESVFDHASGQSIALDSSHRLGLEFQLVVAPTEPLRLRLDLTLVDARYDRSDRPVAGVAAVVSSLQAELDLSPVRVFVRALLVGPRPLTYGARGAGLFDLGLGADWSIGAWRIGLNIDNALDLEQRAGVYHFASHWDPTTPRSSLPRLAFAAGPPLSLRLTVELTP